AAGAGLLALVLFVRDLLRPHAEDPVSTDGWALTFGSLGVILTLTGLHMSLTWPLASGGFAFDNVIFGETSLGFGVLMSALAIYLWKRGETVAESPAPLVTVARAARPLSIFIAGLGLALIAIMAAGIVYQLFAAPPQEPISGAFAEWPIVEAIFMSALFGLIGVGAVLAPFAISAFARTRRGQATHQAAAVRVPSVAKIVGWLWLICGLVFVLLGAMTFSPRVGLIVHAMGGEVLGMGRDRLSRTSMEEEGRCDGQRPSPVSGAVPAGRCGAGAVPAGPCGVASPTGERCGSGICLAPAGGAGASGALTLEARPRRRSRPRGCSARGRPRSARWSGSPRPDAVAPRRPAISCPRRSGRRCRRRRGARPR